MNSHNIIFVMAFLFSFLIFSCKEDTVSPTNSNNSIKIVYPLNNAVVGDTLNIKILMQNPEDVLKVEYFVNGSLINTSVPTDNFQCLWQVLNDTLGRKYNLWAKAYSKSGGVVSSDTVLLHYKWNELIIDPNESFTPNAKRLLIRNGTTKLELRLESYGVWNNPFNLENGISFGVFFDSDQNRNTGKLQLMPVGDRTFDIGADYLIITGLEDNGLYKYDTSSASWVRLQDLVHVDISNNSDYCEMSILRSQIGNPQEITLIALLLCSFPEGVAKYDWVPDSFSKKYKMNDSYFIMESVSSICIKKNNNRLFLLKNY